MKKIDPSLLFMTAVFLAVCIAFFTAFCLALDTMTKEIQKLKTEIVQMQAKHDAFIKSFTEFANTVADDFRNLTEKDETKPVTVEFGDVRVPSNLTEKQIDDYLDDFPELKPLSNIFYENDDQINAIFAMAVMRLESGNGKAIGEKNNIASVRDFHTGEYVTYPDIIEATCAWYDLLNSQYLCENGTYFSGYDVESIRAHYNPDNPEWTSLVVEIMSEIFEKI